MDRQHVTDHGFAVGDFQIEPELCVILGPTGAHFLRPRTIRLLVALARRPGAPVPRRQLASELWPDRVDAEKALTRAIGCLRHAFGDNARMPRYVETVPGLGYRLLAPVDASLRRTYPEGWSPKTPSALRSAPPAQFHNRFAAFFRELRQRKVFGASAVYAIIIWLVFQVSEIVFPALGLPDLALTFVVVTGILGFPVVAVMSWIFDLRLQQAGVGEPADSRLLWAPPSRHSNGLASKPTDGQATMSHSSASSGPVRRHARGANGSNGSAIIPQPAGLEFGLRDDLDELLPGAMAVGGGQSLKPRPASNGADVAEVRAGVTYGPNFERIVRPEPGVFEDRGSNKNEFADVPGTD